MNLSPKAFFKAVLKFHRCCVGLRLTCWPSALVDNIPRKNIGGAKISGVLKPKF